MRYTVEVLTPLLVGDGSALSPIDYMVWKDQVNVLDQNRIFRLLSKGPRLDNYLAQVKRAEKLDFASWGGFAQNYAGRRIPFEHPSCAAHWERLRSEFCHIPTFACSHRGPYLPASALRGALRTALIASSAREQDLAAAKALFEGDRPPRRPGEAVERRVLDNPTPGHDSLKSIRLGDSTPVALPALQIYMLRTATLAEARGAPGPYRLGWKQSPRGTVDGNRAQDSTPYFAEMAKPGTRFEGKWSEPDYFRQEATARNLRWRNPVTGETVIKAANRHARTTLAAHKQFAVWTSLETLAKSLAVLEARLTEAEQTSDQCVVSLGWGGGMLGKTAWPDTSGAECRDVLGKHPIYGRSIRSGLPFPKTRRVVFEQDRPSALPGWVLLRVGE